MNFGFSFAFEENSMVAAHNRMPASLPSNDTDYNLSMGYQALRSFWSIEYNYMYISKIKFWEYRDDDDDNDSDDDDDDDGDDVHMPHDPASSMVSLWLNAQSSRIGACKKIGTRIEQMRIDLPTCQPRTSDGEKKRENGNDTVLREYFRWQARRSARIYI